MKSDPTRDTPERLKELIRENPELSPIELGALLGVTSSRVRGIAKDYLHKRWILKGRWGKV